MSGNSATNSGGGIDNDSGTLTLTNSIVAKNSAPSNAEIFGSHAGSNNLIGGDPLFIMDVPTAPSTGGDLRLQCGSPAIDMGDDAANMTTEDILGNPRKIGTIDIGAYERPADTGTKIVTTIEDDGQGSLRDIVRTACAGDTIRFHDDLNMDTIELITEITLDKNLVIIGNDTTNTIIDGMNTSRIFHIPAGDTVSISGVTMQNGNGAGVQPFSGTTIGGAIFNQGTVMLTNAMVRGNSAYSAGGISNYYGTLTLTNSAVSGNTTSDSGGGISNTGSTATLTMTNSTVSGNSAYDGGGIYNYYGTLTLTNSTVSGNTTSDSGGGIFNFISTMTLTNSTVSGNTASNSGGGIFNEFGTVMLTNSIVAKNTAPNNPEIFGSHAGSNNLIGGDPLFIMDVPTAPSTGGDLRLTACSQAINAGLNTALPKDTFDIDMDLDSMEMLPLDLAGMPRVFDEVVDIGAYEFQSTLFTLSCMDTTLYLDGSGMATIDTSMVIEMIVSACPLDTVYLADPIVDCDDTEGPISVELIAVNERGDTLRCMPTITVVDTISPVVMCTDTTIYLDAAGAITIDSSYVIASISDACGIASASVSQTSYTCADVGANTVTLTVTDHNGNVSTCIATVTVLDTIAPQIMCRQAIVYLDASGTAMIDESDVILSNSDACGSSTIELSQSTFTCADIGTRDITLTATDLSGNTSTCQSTITVIGYEFSPIAITGPVAVCPSTAGVWSIPVQPTGTSYTWTFDDQPVGSTGPVVDFMPEASGTLKVVISNGCDTEEVMMDIIMSNPELCAYMNCALEQLYIDGEFLNHDDTPTDIRATISISSNGTVDNGESYKFYAGDSIVMLPLFEVELGGLFEAHIEPCQVVTEIINTWPEEQKRSSPAEIRALLSKALESRNK